MLTEIRDFDDYKDAKLAVEEAGFVRVTKAKQEKGKRVFAPTVTYKHPDTGEIVDVIWSPNRGYIRRW